MRMQGFFLSWLVGFYFDIFQNKLLPKLGFGVEGLREGCSPLLCITKLFYMNQKSLFEENCQLCKETRRGWPGGRLGTPRRLQLARGCWGHGVGHGPHAVAWVAGLASASVFYLSRFLMNLWCHLISQTEMSGYRNNLWS